VGDAKQILNVQSNAVFAGSVLVRGGLSVAGSIQTSAPMSLPGLTVGGSASIDQLQVTKSLSVSGTASLQNGLTVAKNLNVSGDGTFTGNLSATQLTVNSFQLNNDLTLTHHIVAGGGTPSRSTGTALGSGGTSSVSGSDTAGSISVNTGSSPAAGCFITVNFTGKYNNTPHVIVTPINSGAGGLPYYVTRTSTNFSVCTTSPAPANSNFGFDYIVIG
jgi:cytoskeletal protein CcmA (bactofilin family)